MIIIGIDPGKHTGLASWQTRPAQLLHVGSMLIHQAMGEVHRLAGLKEIGQLLVIVEDARQRKFFTRADEQTAKYGNAVREGAGAAKRDATIWDDYLQDIGVPYVMRKPHGTKSNAEQFKRLTGWQERTNEHSRDAGMIVYQINEPMARRMLEETPWWQRRNAA